MFAASFQVPSAILPAPTGFRMSKTLGHGLLRATAESEGRVKPFTPVQCQFDSSMQEIKNRLYSFNAFIGNLGSSAEGWEMFVPSNYSHSLYMLSQKGLQFLKRLAFTLHVTT